MKVLLFTHAPDIDGLGNVVLSKLAFEDVKFELCENSGLGGINDIFKKYYDNKEIYKYDKIFFTDIGLSAENVELLNTDTKLKGKVFMFDHHASQYDIKDKYDWAKILIENEDGKCCGTSLFYEYLVDNNLINETNLIKEFVEFTRQYDTWEWKDIYNNKIPEDMTILLYVIDAMDYIDTMYDKLLKNETNGFVFNEKERYLIDLEENKIQKYITEKIGTMIVKEIGGHKAGVIFAEKYGNFIAEKLRQIKAEVDYAVLIDLSLRKSHYRSMGKLETWPIAVKYGGKGNKFTGGSPISIEQIEKIIGVLYKL